MEEGIKDKNGKSKAPYLSDDLCGDEVLQFDEVELHA